jgi:hypothetical protein
MEQIVELMVLDTPDPAGIIYPFSVVEDGITDINRIITEKEGVLGECGVPNLSVSNGGRGVLTIDLARASHIVKHVWIKNSVVYAKIFLLGRYAEIADRLKVDFLGIPRGVGKINGKNKMCTEYTLITVDIILPE